MKEVAQHRLRKSTGQERPVNVVDAVVVVKLDVTELISGPGGYLPRVLPADQAMT